MNEACAEVGGQLIWLIYSLLKNCTWTVRGSVQLPGQSPNVPPPHPKMTTKKIILFNWLNFDINILVS